MIGDGHGFDDKLGGAHAAQHAAAALAALPMQTPAKRVELSGKLVDVRGRFFGEVRDFLVKAGEA